MAGILRGELERGGACWCSLANLKWTISCLLLEVPAGIVTIIMMARIRKAKDDLVQEPTPPSAPPAPPPPKKLPNLVDSDLPLTKNNGWIRSGKKLDHWYYHRAFGLTIDHCQLAIFGLVSSHLCGLIMWRNRKKSQLDINDEESKWLRIMVINIKNHDD